MNNNNSVLMLVDDDPVYTRILSHQLKNRGYQCLVCNDATQVLPSAQASSLNGVMDSELPDVFILDYHLGNESQSGLDLCRQIRVYLDRPVIMLSTDDTTDIKVSCLNGGADQYIVKPCDLEELVARIEVVNRNRQRLSRVSGHQGAARSAMTIPLSETFRLDRQSHSIIGDNGKSVPLTEKEAALLELFFCQQPHFINRYGAFQSLYGYEMDPSNRSIDILISRLRRKLATADPSFRIRTRRGEGYELSLG